MIREREIDGAMAEFGACDQQLKMELCAAKELIQQKLMIIAAQQRAARYAELCCRAKCRLYALFGALGMAAVIVAMGAW
jgi:hypothetical protein